MTQVELAKVVGIRSSTLSRIEAGVIAYTQPVLESLASALHCTVSDLLERDPAQASRDEIRQLIDAIPGPRRPEAVAVLRILAGKAA